MATTASTEKMNMEKDLDLPKKKLINTNLISLKCLLFIFFGGKHRVIYLYSRFSSGEP